MDLKVTFLGRAANRWRARVDLPPGARPLGLTVGLWGEDGRPISPTVVVPAGCASGFVAELAGPAELPPGTHVRAFADMEDGTLLEGQVGVHRRTGLHAFLHGDLNLHLTPAPNGAALNRVELARLARVHPWVAPDAPSAPESRSPPAPPAGLPEDVLDMLRHDFDVDVDDMDDDLIAALHREATRGG